ncbi:hypothetical protein [Actinomadura sp. CNU-125]|uniref:hypothetical protein n=1 Tax=Actinomadura sp. CNU-125 TaxID=1904961 RepID=UPI0021CC866B|nr:hypothetical protein [Actinomadura sp. CNU-125]
MAADGVAGEVGDQQPGAVRVDLDAEGVPGLGAEAVAAGGAAERGAVAGRDLGDQAVRGQLGEDAFGGGARHPDPFGEGGQREVAAGAERAEGRGGVEAAQHRGICSVRGRSGHGTPLQRSASGRLYERCLRNTGRGGGGSRIPSSEGVPMNETGPAAAVAEAGLGYGRPGGSDRRRGRARRRPAGTVRGEASPPDDVLNEMPP